MKRKIAAAVAAAMAGAPGAVHAKPPRPGIHKEAEQAHKAAQPYRETIQKAAREWGLGADTLEALLWKESRFNTKAANKKKARGIAQFTPSGAAAVGRIQKQRGKTPWFSYSKTLDPIESIKAAAEFVAFLLDLCGGLTEAIGAYNTGKCTSNAFSRSVMRLAGAIRFVTGDEPRT